jgi:biotin carboxyl carrier protein
MTFELTINGRTRVVAIEASGPDRRLLRVTVDGRAHTVEARELDPFSLSLIVGPGDGAVSHLVRIARNGNDTVSVHLPRLVAEVQIDPGRHRRFADETEGVTGEQRVASPMPGRILRVLVKPGDEVKARQPLVVVEAMKMENELVSPKMGRVREVAIAEGVSVEAGRLLVVIE